VKDIATSTGRVGNYANLEIDGVFKEYSLESKSRKKLPKWLVHGLVDQAIKASKKFCNNPLLVLRSSGLPQNYRTWHMITPERHAELLDCEQRVEAAEADQDLMIKKFDDDYANAVEFYAERDAKKGTRLPKVKDLSHTIKIDDGWDDD